MATSIKHLRSLLCTHLRKLNIDNMYDNMSCLFIVKCKVSENETRQQQSQPLSLKLHWALEDKDAVSSQQFRQLVSDQIEDIKDSNIMIHIASEKSR